MSGGTFGRRWVFVQPCGTEAAYRRHYRRGQRPCQRCIDAHNLAAEAYRQALNAQRSERYYQLRAAGLSAADAKRESRRGSYQLAGRQT